MREPASLDAWKIVSPLRAAALLSSVRVPWWVAGGWALDLFLGGADSRPHQDLDIGILRRDLQEVLRAFDTWEVFAAKDAALEPLQTGERPRHDVHSLWCRPNATAPWNLELMLDESQDDLWLFRRAPQIRRPLSEIVRVSSLGIPYLAPEIQLLYKAKGMRERDAADFDRTLPRLDIDQREWLLRAMLLVHPEHEWIDALRDAATS
jgi:Aminoglycoside-2''-adenylyltransferase